MLFLLIIALLAVASGLTRNFDGSFGGAVKKAPAPAPVKAAAPVKGAAKPVAKAAAPAAKVAAKPAAKVAAKPAAKGAAKPAAPKVKKGPVMTWGGRPDPTPEAVVDTTTPNWFNQAWRLNKK